MSDVLAELERELASLPPDALAEIDRLLEPELNKRWLQVPGPQTQCYESKADLVLYGGSAGSLKSDTLLGIGLTGPHQSSVIYRAHYGDLAAIERRAIEIMGSRDGYNGADMTWALPDRYVDFRAIGKPGAEESAQGQAKDFIGVDEAAQLSAEKVRFVLGWNRSAKEGQRSRAVLATNPPMGGEGDWLIEWFAPWLDPLHPLYPTPSGVLQWCVTGSDGRTIWVKGPGEHLVEGEREALIAKSRTFIPGKLSDNPYLRDTDYRAQIMQFPEPKRSQLLHGDFLAARQDHEWQVIPTDWVREAQRRWKKEKPEKQNMVAIGVDPSLGGADDTVLAPLYGVWFDTLRKHKGVNIKSGADIGALIIKERRDGAAINIDMTGGWGDGARVHLESNKIPCTGVVFSAKSYAKNKTGTYGFINMRSELWWLFREALDPETGHNIALPPDKRLFAQLTAPRYDYRGADIKIESKEDIKDRLGSSTDDADAVILAWHNRRPVSTKRRGHRDRRGSWLSA